MSFHPLSNGTSLESIQNKGLLENETWIKLYLILVSLSCSANAEAIIGQCKMQRMVYIFKSSQSGQVNDRQGKCKKVAAKIAGLRSGKRIEEMRVDEMMVAREKG